MRILFSTGSPENYMAPPRLAEEQINCGPDWPDATAADGRVLSRKTPVGEYDLACVAALLPLQQQPDAVVCLVDASWRNLPRNLGVFKCPKVLLVADTHHLKSPLIGMLHYLSTEPFDRVVLLYDRHHAPFFHAAGFNNLFWFPGLTFPHSDATVRAARAKARTAHVAFVGQAGKHHPRRARLLRALAAARLPVAARPLPQAEALGFYGRSLLGFNASLNGDLNLRIFEILATGAGLLTDRLAPEAGLARLLADGRECATYGDEAELVACARHYLARPAEAHALGAAGAAWFDTWCNETRRRELFRDLVLHGREAPGFELGAPATTRVFFGGDTDRLVRSLVVYEEVQELHRTQETVRVRLDAAAGAPEDFGAICATLPRVQLTRTAAEGPADLAVGGTAALESAPSPEDAARLWCWDATEGQVAPPGRTLEARGWMAADEALGLFCRPALAPAAELSGR